MNVRRLVAAMAAVTSVVGVAVSADAAVYPPQVLLDTLDSPTGRAVDKSGALIIAQDDYPLFTPSPSITRVPLLGPQRLQPIPVTNLQVPYDVAVNPTNGRLWIIDRLSGHVMRQRVDGSFVTVIDMRAYRAGDPDPVAQPEPQLINDVGEPPIFPTASSRPRWRSGRTASCSLSIRPTTISCWYGRMARRAPWPDSTPSCCRRPKYSPFSATTP